MRPLHLRLEPTQNSQSNPTKRLNKVDIKRRDESIRDNKTRSVDYKIKDPNKRM